MKFSKVLIPMLMCVLALQMHAGQSARCNGAKYALIGGAAVAVGAATYALFARPDACKRMFRCVRNCFFSPSKEILDQFFFAVRDADLSTVQRFIENDIVNIDIRDCWGVTALMQATTWNHEGLVRFLIENGADVNAQDDRGKTALHLAKRIGMAQLLLENGASIGARDNRGVIPLHDAARRQEEDLVRLLLARGAEVNALAKSVSCYGNISDGGTPLHFLVRHDGGVVLTRVFLDEGADVDLLTEDGRTVLHEAVCSGYDDSVVVQQLLVAGANRYAQTREGKTPLHLAADKGWNAKTLRVLLSYGVRDVNLLDKGGSSPLYYAVRSAVHPKKKLDTGFAKRLVECGARLTSKVKCALSGQCEGFQSLFSKKNGLKQLREELIKAQNIPVLRQALGYLDKDEHAHGTRVPTDVQEIIRDMVLESEQRARLAQLR